MPGPVKVATGSEAPPDAGFVAGFPATRLWLLRLVSLVALAISLYLLFVSISERGPMGCGASSSCAQVLNSRWSTWLGVPVSGPGAVVYLVLVVSTFFLSPSKSPVRKRRAWEILAIGSALAASASVWFMGVQIVAVGSLCKYCLVVHSCGLIAAGLVWTGIPVGRSHRSLLEPINQDGVTPRVLLALATFVLAATGVLIAGQVLFPAQTYRISVTPPGGVSKLGTVPIATNRMPNTQSATQPVESPDIAKNRITFVAGGRTIHLDPEKVPVIGSPNARYFIVMLGDYTCSHCQVTHQTLDRLRKAYGDQVAVVMLPTPLDPGCDPYVPPTMHFMAQDCALARLAIAVWCANPKLFPVMDQWLFAENRFRQEDEARLFARQLVGAKALQKAEADPRMREMIRQDCDFYAACGLGLVPKLLFGSTDVSGRVSDERILFAPIEKEWGIKPLPQ